MLFKDEIYKKKIKRHQFYEIQEIRVLKKTTIIEHF